MPTPQTISPAPASPALSPSWRLGVTAKSLSDGQVMLYADVPGAGQLSVVAASSVRVASAHAAGGAGSRHGKSAGGHAGASKVLIRTVATAKRAVGSAAGGLTTLLLTLSHSYAALASRHAGLSAIVTVSFSSPGHPLLRQRLTLSFLRKASAHKAKRSSTAGSHHQTHASRPR